MHSLEQFRMTPGDYAKAVHDGKVTFAHPTGENDLAAFTKRIRPIQRIPIHYPFAEQERLLPDGSCESTFFRLHRMTGHLPIEERVAIRLWDILHTTQHRFHVGHELEVLGFMDQATIYLAKNDWARAAEEAGKIMASRMRFFFSFAADILATSQQAARKYTLYSPAVHVPRGVRVA